MPGSPLRRAMWLGYLNGALWSIGNGLTTGTLIIYLAMELGGRGTGVSLILALPSVVGLLRIFAPFIIRLCRTAKRACLATCLVSYILLLGLPALTLAPTTSLPVRPLTAIFGLLCIHQLLEYLGTVALWSWLADLIPRRIRGRFFGRRQMWQLAVLIPTLWLSGMFTDRWKTAHPDQPLVGYAIPNGLGAILLLASLVPLAAMPGSVSNPRQPAPPAATIRTLFTPLGDARFRRLLTFGCWFSFFNGLTQAPQNIFPKRVLGIGLEDQAVMRTIMQVGQFGASYWLGPFSDRYGNRPVLIVSQLLVATGPLFFLLSSPEQPYWIYGAWIMWSAYAGINLCLPNLMLKLSDGRDHASYIGTYFAVTSLCYAGSTVAGGFLFDYLNERTQRYLLWGVRWNLYEYLFLCGWATRTMGVIWLLRIVEPGAWTWRQIFRRPAHAQVEPGEQANG